MSKGSRQRSVDQVEFNKNHDAIFGKKKAKPEPKPVPKDKNK